MGATPQFRRFIAVGLGGVALNMVIFHVGVETLALPVAAVTVVAFLVVNAYGFALNRNWSFRHLSGRWTTQAARYSAVMLGSLLMNVSIMVLLTTWLGLNALVASLTMSAALAASNYWAHAKWTFRA